MEIKQVDINELVEAEYNPRQMTEKQVNDLTTSIKDFGIVDPIIVNSNPERFNIIIGGHQRVKVAKLLNYYEVPVYYLDLDEEKEKELNLRLNKNVGGWNMDLLAGFDMDMLKNVGFNSNDLNLNIDKFDEYTKKIVPPVYKPSAEKPSYGELFNDIKTKEFLHSVNNMQIDDSVKEFLLNACHRFTIFNYAKIADFYAQADDDVKDIMEKLALVIIDYDKAVENGFVKVSNELFNIEDNE